MAAASRPDWAPPARFLASEDERDGPAWTGNNAFPVSHLLRDQIGAVLSLADKGNIGILLGEEKTILILLFFASLQPQFDAILRKDQRIMLAKLRV